MVLLKTALLFFPLALYVSAQYYNNYNANMGGIGCVVTGNKLFSHGNYIRDIKGDEVPEMNKYKEELLKFQKVVTEAYADITLLNNPNATLPVIPPRPAVPKFCTSNETTLYIIGSCSVQNHKIYVNGKYARDLNAEEKDKLVEFTEKLAQISQPTTPSPDTNSTEVADQPQPVMPTLDFCTEF